jgi:hypothetical protein
MGVSHIGGGSELLAGLTPPPVDQTTLDPTPVL